jgi:hypothetical protein
MMEMRTDESSLEGLSLYLAFKNALLLEWNDAIHSRSDHLHTNRSRQEDCSCVDMYQTTKYFQIVARLSHSYAEVIIR